MEQREIWELNLNNLKSGVFGEPNSYEALLRYWQAQEKAEFPMARENVLYYTDMVVKENNELKQCNQCIHFAACCKWTDFPKQCGTPVCSRFMSRADVVTSPEIDYWKEMYNIVCEAIGRMCKIVDRKEEGSYEHHADQ